MGAENPQAGSLARRGGGGGHRAGVLTRPAHADAVQVLRPHEVEVFRPRDVELLKDGPVELRQLHVPEQPKQPQGTGFREHVCHTALGRTAQPRAGIKEARDSI